MQLRLIIPDTWKAKGRDDELKVRLNYRLGGLSKTLAQNKSKRKTCT